MIVLLAAGIVFLLAGLASIVAGVPVKEFSFGNTLILAGVIGVCTGSILLGLSAVIRELRALGAGIGADEPASGAGVKVRPVFPPAAASEAAGGRELFAGDRPEPDLAPPPPSAAAFEPPAPTVPWQEPAAREHVRPRPAPLEISPPPPPPPAADDAADETATPKRRNLLFSSTSRKERQRAAARAGVGEGAAAATPEPAAPAPQVPAPRTFDEAWPEPGRNRGERSARPGRSPDAAETSRETPASPDRGPADPEPQRSEDAQQVTVLKSGVVDGMAYSLYSDGSIEAQMPEGMMRFASIDELRAHLDQRS